MEPIRLQRPDVLPSGPAGAVARYEAIARGGPCAQGSTARDAFDAEAAGLLREHLAGLLSDAAFVASLEALASLLAHALDAAPGRGPAAPRPEQVARVAATPLPGFVERTARDLLAAIASAEDAPERDALGAQLEVCLAFGRDVTGEEIDALRRFFVLEAEARRGHRAARLPRSAIEDSLEALGEMLRKLDSGLYPLAAFRQDFDRAAGEFERLLAGRNDS